MASQESRQSFTIIDTISSPESNKLPPNSLRPTVKMSLRIKEQPIRKGAGPRQFTSDPLLSPTPMSCFPTLYDKRFKSYEGSKN